jgi:3-hydroxyisobutyrate dehydrogenase-like beta-hydroxyacid dehydrogenase
MNPAITKSIQLGFIGIGNMGSRIARRLLDHGYALMVYDSNVESTAPLTKDGATLAASVADLARKADVVLSCLTNDKSVRSVYRGPDGVIANARLGSIVLEMSTVSPDTSREVYELGCERGLNVLDIAISGSTPAAEQGALTLLAGGDIEIFNAVESILRVIARQYFHLGASGSGTTMKLVVNTLLGVGMQTVAEAVAFGEKAGLDRNRLLEVLAKTAVIPPALVGKLARVSQGDYSPQFPLQLMNKDFRLILETAAAMKAPMPVTAAAFQINSAELASETEADFSIVVKLMETLANLHVGEPAQTGSIDKQPAPASPDLQQNKPAA